jgi:hypothetical protein
MLLAKATSSLCGAHDDIILPPETRKLAYEVELKRDEVSLNRFGIPKSGHF